LASTWGRHTVSRPFGDGATAVSGESIVAQWGDRSLSDALVILAAGDSKQCTITNEKKPKLTVTKKIIGGNGATDSFDVKVDGVTKIDNAISKAGGGTRDGPFDSTAGSHTVTETFGDGKTAVSSDWIVTFSGDCNSGGVVTLAAGDSKQCTITNEKKPKLTVTKKIIGGNGATDSFDVKVDGVTKIDNAISKAGGGTRDGPFDSTAGSHTVTETFGDGKTAVSSDWIVTFSGDCNSGGVVSLAAGDSKQCTITNEKKPKLTVTKKIVGGNGTTDSFDVKVDGVTKIDNAVSTAAAGTSAGPFASTVGSHTVSETFGDGATAVNGDWTVTSGGDGNSSTGVVNLASGDSKQCTITNEKKPKLTVTKKIIGGNGTTDSFDVKVDGDTKIDNAVSTAAAGTSAGPFTVTAGNHTVSETFGDGATAVNSDWTVTISGDCNSSTGVVSLVAGDSKQCTITKEKKPKLTVTKKIIGGNGTTDSFDVKVDGVTKIDNAVSTDPAGTSVGPFNSSAGSHT